MLAVSGIIMMSVSQGTEVVSAKLAEPVYCQGEYLGQREDEAYSANYATCFAKINFDEIEATEEEGMFGIPISFIVETRDKCFILYMNNAYGIFSVYQASKNNSNVYTVSDDYIDSSKVVYLPTLYDKLKDVGINILDEKQLQNIRTLPKNEYNIFLKQYKKVIDITRNSVR